MLAFLAFALLTACCSVLLSYNFQFRIGKYEQLLRIALADETLQCFLAQIFVKILILLDSHSKSTLKLQILAVDLKVNSNFYYQIVL